MTKPSYMEKIEAYEVLAQDAIDHLTTDLSIHDRIYERKAKRKIGQRSRLITASGAFLQARKDEFVLEPDAPQLFPEIEVQELETAVRGFAQTVGRDYVDWLFLKTLHDGRQYRKEAFPHPDGHNRCASQYIDYAWAPQYAADFALAHELGLTKGVVEELAEITGGAEAMK